jgi:hypothetical protein
MLVRKMIETFGCVSCDYPDCPATYDVRLQVVRTVIIKASNKPDGWYFNLDRGHARCPKHAGSPR